MPSAIVISTWPLVPVNNGGRRRIAALLKALGQHAVVMQPSQHHPEHITVPYPIDLGRRKIRINCGIFNFYLGANRKIARQFLLNHSPGCAILTSIWGEPVVHGLKDLPVVLDAHDVNVIAMAERYGKRHPFTKLVKAQEARTLRGVDHLFTCSERDRSLFVELYGVPLSKVTVVPNGVDTPTLPPNVDLLSNDTFWQSNAAGRTPLFFMGKLDYEPNIRALDFLNASVMPELQQRSPGTFKLIVCGAPVPKSSFHPDIAFAGSLDDRRLQAYLDGASICLAPIFTGSGTRLKILEFLSAAKPVVATAKAAEGIPVESGMHLIIAKPSAFTEEILALAKDPSRSRSLARAGQALVAETCDWTRAIQPKWKSILDQWCNFSPEPPWPRA